MRIRPWVVCVVFWIGCESFYLTIFWMMKLRLGEYGRSCFMEWNTVVHVSWIKWGTSLIYVPAVMHKMRHIFNLLPDYLYVDFSPTFLRRTKNWDRFLECGVVWNCHGMKMLSREKNCLNGFLKIWTIKVKGKMKNKLGKYICFLTQLKFH